MTSGVIPPDAEVVLEVSEAEVEEAAVESSSS